MKNDPARGRPRSFDRDEVLEKVMHVFWRQGYEGTSYAHLTAATGLNKPSLYAAFGDKQSLFAAALDRYESGPTSQLLAAFAETPHWREGLTALLDGYVTHYSTGREPAGCMIASSLNHASTPDFPPDLRERLKQTCLATRALLTQRAERAARDGELPNHLKPEAVAMFIATFVTGLATAAKGGTSEAELKTAAGLAVASLTRG